MKHSYYDKLLWVDTEFTTTDVKNADLLEIAAVVTDAEYNELAQIEFVVHHDEAVLEKMKDYKLQLTQDKPELAGLQTVYDLQQKSGLLDRVRESENTIEEVEARLLGFVALHFGETPPILAGNSIHFDRSIIERNLPRLNSKLHYRSIDVTSFKLVQLNNGAAPYQKKSTHRALEDIRESIAELKYLLDLYKRQG